MAKTPTIASPKISPPRLFKMVSRERLFLLLDEALASSPVVWISGPPGAGKTALVTSYLEQRKLATAWLQIDSGDNDPALLFHYLSETIARTRPRSKVKLPVFGPEYAHDLSGFSRRFFRQAVEFMPRPSVLVLDNYQDANSALFQSVVHGAIEETAVGAGLVIVSRTLPGTALSRQIANHRLREITWEDLRFTVDETQQLLQAEGPSDIESARSLHRCIDGWAAGLVLLRGRERGREGQIVDWTALPKETIFDYFATESLAGAEPALHDFLLRSAFLPRLTGTLAQAITGREDAAQVLESLYRRNLFIQRKSGTPPVYQYHDLFLRFLRSQAELSMADGARQRLVRQAAALLDAAGEEDEATRLLLAFADWSGAVERIAARAPALLGEGRYRTLSDWIESLPSAAAADHAWLRYWLACALLHDDELRSRRCFEQAFDLFAGAGNVEGQLLSAAAIVEAIHAESFTYSALERWAGELKRLHTARPPFASPELEMRALSGVLIAALLTLDAELDLSATAQRVHELLSADIDINQRLRAASHLAEYFDFCADYGAVESLKFIVDALPSQENVSSQARAGWLISLANQYICAGLGEKARPIAQEVRRLAQAEGLGNAEFEAEVMLAVSALDNGNVADATEILHRAEVFPLSGIHRLQIARYHYARARLCMLLDQPSPALYHAQRCLELCAEAEMPINLRTLYLVTEACAYLLAGRHEQALRGFELTAQLSQGAYAQFDAAMLTLVRGYVAVCASDHETARRCLQEGLAWFRAWSWANYFRALPRIASRLCAAALGYGIEIDFVRETIRRRRLPALDYGLEAWPWPIKIYTLGRFGVLKDDVPMRFEGKAQRKPLDLLKALIALGGRDVAANKLIDILWPEPLEGGGQKAFDITVHRLRKLLASEDAIQVTDRRATVNQQIVWVDVWSLERSLAPLIPAVNAAEPDIGLLEAAAPQVLKLYRGHFLAGDNEDLWQLPVKNRLAGRFQRFVLRLGQHRESAGQWSGAEALYRRAIELDPLAETFYRRLMVCQREQGQRAEAVEIYRRCRQTLSVVLGVQPTGETEAIYKGLLAS